MKSGSWPIEHEPGAVPGQDLQPVRALRAEDDDHARERDRVEAPRAPGRPGCRRRVGSPPASSRPEPARPPEPRSCRRLHGAQNCRQRRRVSARRDADRRGADHDLDRRGPATRVRPDRGLRSPKGFLDNDRGEGRSARSHLVVRGPSPRPPFRLAPPAKELLRRQPVAPRDSGNLLPALVAFGEDLRLLRRGPRPASTGAGKHLQPTHRLRLGFGQKLSVRHVSNPLDSTGSIFADLRSTLKVRSKGR